VVTLSQCLCFTLVSVSVERKRKGVIIVLCEACSSLYYHYKQKYKHYSVQAIAVQCQGSRRQVDSVRQRKRHFVVVSPQMGVSSKSRLIDLSVEEMHEIIQSAKEVESSGSYFRALVTALFFAGPVVLT
jgi:hypothetical protein